jgi:2-hydroxy-3-oxopropionate reductase
METMSKNPGFCGLGVMGMPMAGNLAGKYPGIKVFDVDVSRAEALVSGSGGTIQAAASIADLGRACDIVFLSLPNSAIVKKVVLGEEGLARFMQKGGTIIDMSTTDTSVVIELEAELKKAGIDFLDAPVSGGEKAARAGTLSIMVGGEERIFSSCLDYLKAIGTSVVRLGGIGSGQVAKCVNQMIVAAAFASIAEAFALGAKKGLDAKTLYDAIKGGWAGSKVLDVVAQDILSREFKPGGTIEMLLKDISYVLTLTREEDFPAPITALAYEIFKAGKAAGDGKKSQTAIIKLWENILKIEVT